MLVLYYPSLSPRLQPNAVIWQARDNAAFWADYQHVCKSVHSLVKVLLGETFKGENIVLSWFEFKQVELGMTKCASEMSKHVRKLPLDPTYLPVVPLRNKNFADLFRVSPRVYKAPLRPVPWKCNVMDEDYPPFPPEKWDSHASVLES